MVRSILSAEVFFGKSPASVPPGSLIFFPYRANKLCCGLTGIVSIHRKAAKTPPADITRLLDWAAEIEAHGYEACRQGDFLSKDYLGGRELLVSLGESVESFKRDDLFFSLFTDLKVQKELDRLSQHLAQIIEIEAKVLTDHMGHLPAEQVDRMSHRIDKLKDIGWSLRSEILANINKIRKLLGDTDAPPQSSTVKIFKKINAVLNSIDRLEVRGRDSAGISLMFVLDESEYDRFQESLTPGDLRDQLAARTAQDPLVNQGISIQHTTDATGSRRASISLTYKIALEIGNLGDNINFLREQIANDLILQHLAKRSPQFDTVCAHTRWASVGAITEANCHPVDNKTVGNRTVSDGMIYTCLNGDIDNYHELKRKLELSGSHIHKDITTDTKIIPLQIEKYIRQNHEVAEAFRLAVNDFEGSHAISMHTDLAPGKIFLAQKGSGQAIFVGLAEDHYMPTSEVYGFVEETSRYVKMDGETIIPSPNGPVQGQIFILSQDSTGQLDGIQAMGYDGTPVVLTAQDIKQTAITSRDIDRQKFPHYFLKEISESPASVEKTLQNRWKIRDDAPDQLAIALDHTVVPPALKTALANDQIKRIFFIGQGTAGVAALACANILNYYLNQPSRPVGALKASEFSGFRLDEHDDATSMADTLVIAISQSGTTTDTNRTVDMVRERGARTLAIVNRRDSDITFKVDGVMYTSSGRDIEMSVASTKAFYSQIIAGALLGLYIARLKGRRGDDFVTAEIRRLLEIPSHMRKILTMGDQIKASAAQLAVTKTYWAAVGSGPNKASADEIRIKLSELCYKTISSDFVEDKKHIDLSSEPLIIVCAAGTRSTVIGDIIKDTAIFKAHKATPIVIADEGEERFGPYADAVFHVAVVSEHLAPILNTLVGHIWGYYAALAINEGSRLLHHFREDIQATIDAYAHRGLDVYEIVLEKTFQEKIAHCYNEFRRLKADRRFPATIGFDAASDLTLLLKYLSGRLPVSDFEIDFGLKGTAHNMLTTLFKCLGDAINYLARPVDAIKHQAKTVTVGTSRLSDRIEGILFEALATAHFNVSQLTNRNIIVLKNLQDIIARIEGSILYRISGLNLLGEPVDGTTI
ncbi:MAG: SIS domain-containing protein, partial [Desulfobacterales bacterium]